MSSTSLPRWGEKAKVLTKLGSTVLATLLLVAYIAAVATDVLGGSVPDPISWTLTGLVGISLALLVGAGVVWLIAEFRTGLREPQRPD
ncbi:hypothetical protein [Solicola sp. PLA-1-18]|uniref:hypothetical protein n=1 Tax=Solicola sp. PLA-1-18 TaxID=3380532 RepID=UPI003BA38D50